MLEVGWSEICFSKKKIFFPYTAGATTLPVAPVLAAAGRGDPSVGHEIPQGPLHMATLHMIFTSNESGNLKLFSMAYAIREAPDWPTRSVMTKGVMRFLLHYAAVLVGQLDLLVAFRVVGHAVPDHHVQALVDFRLDVDHDGHVTSQSHLIYQPIL